MPAARRLTLASLPGRIGGGLLGFTRRLFGALFSTLTVLVLTVYFMADLPRLRHGVRRLFPAAHRDRAGHVADVVVDKVGSYMIGNLLISLAAIPIAAALKVVMAERLDARDTADTDITRGTVP